MNLKKFKIGQVFSFIESNPWIVFVFLGVLIFALFHDLFRSYFEADEWFHFTYYLPLVAKPDGFLTAFLSTIVDTGGILTGAGQHVTPIATEIFFLNTKFFGINFSAYAFMSLLLHAVNSFLVFLFIKTLLYQKQNLTKNLYAVLGALFFAIAPTPMHTVTGAAPFYGQNILSVTFFLLCVIFFKKAFIEKSKRFIYVSVVFLFLSLFSKETTFFLFLLLPFMVVIEKRIFPLKFLGKVFAISLIVYLIFRFVIPNLSTIPGKVIDKFVEGYIPKSYTQPVKAVDTGTIVSRDLSIHKNLPAEILFRSITFPIKMTGTLFVPRQTVFSIVQFITSIVQPVPPGGDSADSSQARLGFLYGPGNGFIIYIAGLGILIFCLSSIIKFIRKRSVQEAQALATGLAIIIASALPLVVIIFSFPRWGYDFYFDSRHYYNPTVGAAIVFPFLLFGIAKLISKTFKIKRVSVVVLVIFAIWLINNMYVFSLALDQFVNKFGFDRREVVSQLKSYLPTLPQKTVFYIETDGLSAYGSILPFNTSVPQALTVVYYDNNPLPDSFFNKTLFDGKTQGYSYSEGRGFGYYYASKKDLSEALISKKFEPSDVHAFYYKSLKGQLLDNTVQVRQEMEDYLNHADIRIWKKFSDSSTKTKFLYPTSTKIEELRTTDASSIKSLMLKDPQFSTEISFINVSPAFSINDSIQFLNQKNGMSLTSQDVAEKSVYFDKYHLNKLTSTNEDQPRYFMKFSDILLYVKTENSSTEGLKLIERILGSLEIIDEK